ncbi:Amine oxidase [Trichuris trichiura]|uniref:Amine oxidase n=1 Tax=Trichuris trichiura TaxID=36087 RepID=A0A077ZGV6_TRITR|nr:Amine oxidase [Trichuris trichiura]
MSVPVLVFVATTKQLSISGNHLSYSASLQAMLLKLLVLCISAVLAAEQVNMELTDDSTFVDQATVRQREPTKMEVEFVEETGTPLESANGLEITELTEDVANAVRPQENGQRTPLPLLSENYLPSIPSRPVQVMSSYVAGPPSVPYSQQGTAVRTGYGRRRKRSPTFLALRKSLKG